MNADHSDASEWREDRRRDLDPAAALHSQNRDVLFENEKFVIKVLQVVSAGAVLASIGQAAELVKLTSELALRTFITWNCLALVVAITAAVFKHQYKMWDVKASAVDAPLSPLI